jgi:MFS family permease
MPLVFTIGSVFGPTLGGALSNPLQVDPHKPHGDRLFERFPYLLPNMVASALFTVGIIVGWLFLKETLESRKHHQDLGLRTGAKLTAFFQSLKPPWRTGKAHQADREPLLGQRKVYHEEAEQTLAEASEATEIKKPRIRDVLTYQTTLNLVVYTCLAFYTMAYDQVALIRLR